MKKLLFALLFITIIIACKKIDFTKFHFTNNEITETDINGNLTGSINNNDWKLHKFSDASDFDKKNI